MQLANPNNISYLRPNLSTKAPLNKAVKAKKIPTRKVNNVAQN